MTLRSVLLALLLALATAVPASAQVTGPIHADTPLWRPGGDDIWPQHFFDDSGAFGCVHAVKLGVWRYHDAEPESSVDDSWYRLTNYGVMHCWMNVAEADAPDAFGDTRPGFLVKIGAAGGSELWALQLGARPSSDYLLLARAPGVLDRFTVLQTPCPKSAIRGGPSLDILVTRYCSINSKREMLALARRAAKLPPAGTLTFEHVVPDPD